MSDIIVPKALDKILIDFYQVLVEKFGAEKLVYRVGNISLDPQDQGAEKVIKKLKREITYSITHVSCQLGGMSVVFNRGTRQSVNTQYSSNAHADTLVSLSTYPDDFDFIAYNKLIEDKFKISAAASLQLGEPHKNLLLTHQEIIAKLEASLASISERFSDARLEMESEFSERRKELDDDTSKQKVKLQAEYDNKVSDLEVQIDALKKREGDLDDRDNTHVRREIRQQFKEELSSYKDKYELTKGTRDLRFPVHLTVWTILMVFVMGIVFFATQPYPSSQLLLQIFWSLKPLGLTVAAIGLVTWYLNWIAKWSERHAQAEFELRNLEMDMDRASWVVESSLEWKDVEGSNIPDHLLEALSRNLFSSENDKNEHSLSAADQLASALMGQASKASLNIGGNTVEFDRKALKQAGKSSE